MPEFTLDMFQTAGVAMLLLLLGQRLTERTAFLRRCCIPAPSAASSLWGGCRSGISRSLSR